MRARAKTITHMQAKRLARRVFTLLRLGHLDLEILAPAEPDEHDAGRGETTQASVAVVLGRVELRLFPAFFALTPAEATQTLLHEALHVHLEPLDAISSQLADATNATAGFSPAWTAVEESVVLRLEHALAPILVPALLRKK